MPLENDKFQGKVMEYLAHLTENITEMRGEMTGLREEMRGEITRGGSSHEKESGLCMRS